MRNIIILLCLSLNFAPYTLAQKSVLQPTKNITGRKTTNQAIPADTLIKLERTICYGKCPIYKVEINARGKLIYEGIEFVKTKGKVVSTLSQQQMQLLLAEIEKAQYFSLRKTYVDEEDGCTTIATHFPSVYTTIRMNKKTKSVKYYIGCFSGSDKLNASLEKIDNLTDKIDEIINIEKWVGRSNKTPNSGRIETIKKPL